jgi:hemolysin activation/secretion protein
MHAAAIHRRKSVRAKRQPRRLACAIFMSTLFHGAMAATPQPGDPDALIRQQLELERQRQLPAPKATSPLDVTIAPDGPAGPAVPIEGFAFEGNERYSDAQLQAIVTGFLHRDLSFADLEAAGDAIARHYRAAGWMARVVIPPQQVQHGVVRLKVIEGVLGATRIVDGHPPASLPVDPKRIIATVQARQAPGDKMNIPAIERGLLLADDLPGLGVSGRQAAGTKEGETDLLLEVSAKSAYVVDANLDNFGSLSTGTTRASLHLGANSPLHAGDQFDVLAQQTQDMLYGRLAGSLPIGVDGLRLSANGAWLRYKVGTPEFAVLAPRGNSSSMGVDLLYPVVRLNERNAYLDLSTEHKRPYNTSNTGLISDYDIDNVVLKVDANALNMLAPGSISSLSLAQLWGRLNLAHSPAAYVAADAGTVRTAGSFRIIRYRATNMQAISSELSLTTAVSGQAPNKNLDSSEKFYLGGPYGVRAYPPNEAGGSKGQMVNLDLRWRPASLGAYGVELSSFYDWGRIAINVNSYPKQADLNQYALSGYGLGLAVNPSRQVKLSLALAKRIDNNPGADPRTGKDQDGTLLRTRTWLEAAVNF